MKRYEAPPTIGRFIHDRSRVQLLLGPIGGGKTTGVLMKLLLIAHAQKPNQAGQRKTRFACVRNTRPQLRDSVLKTVFDWMPPNGSTVVWRESDMTMILRIALDDGTFVHSEILFRALDDEQDARRLLSVEFTAVWLSEFREIPLQLLTDALSRTGRYPSAADGGATWHGVLGESNMPVRGSEWFTYLETKRPSYAIRFIQPSGIADDAENTANLPPDYYSVLMEGTTLAWQQSHILSEYPDSLDGKAVWAQSFSYARHVSKTTLAPLVGSFAPTILLGVDQGRSPAGLFSQVQPNGKLLVLREVSASGLGMDRFASEYLRPIVVQHYPGHQILVVIDPAGTYKSQNDDDSPADVLRRAGFKVIPAPTNAIDRRLDAVDRLLIQNDGLEIDGVNCPILVSAMASDYRFKLKKNGEAEETPEKKHPISDLADALQYTALIAGGANYGRIVSRMNRHAIIENQAPPPTAGWT